MRYVLLDDIDKIINIIELDNSNVSLYPGAIKLNPSDNCSIGDYYSRSTNNFNSGDDKPEKIQFIKDQLKSSMTQLETQKAQSLIRGSRELQLIIMEKQAKDSSIIAGTTQEFELSHMPYYVKLKAIDTAVTTLRLQLEAM